MSPTDKLAARIDELNKEIDRQRRQTESLEKANQELRKHKGVPNGRPKSRGTVDGRSAKYAGTLAGAGGFVALVDDYLHEVWLVVTYGAPYYIKPILHHELIDVAIGFLCAGLIGLCIQLGRKFD